MRLDLFQCMIPYAILSHVHLCLQWNSICCQCPWDPFIFSFVLTYFTVEVLTIFCCLPHCVPLRAEISVHTRTGSVVEWCGDTHKAANKLVKIWKQLVCQSIAHLIAVFPQMWIAGPIHCCIASFKSYWFRSMSAETDPHYTSLWMITMKVSQSFNWLSLKEILRTDDNLKY